MKRLLSQALLEWKNRENRKPLILKGVRQCGKTYLMKEFGEENYEDVAYFNFEETDSLKTLFEMDYDTKRILFELGLIRGKTIQPETTLILFDEIQECGRAITSLKYFCENAPEYPIISAGSLLGVALNRQPSFPVGKVDFLTLYPMNFLEFLMANGEEALADYLLSLDGGSVLSEPITNKLAGYLKQYYVTGGMPEVVQTWCNTHDMAKAERVQQTILDSYQFDFSKHAPVKDFPKIAAIWQSIPEQLARDNSKFMFGHVRKGWRSKDLEDALVWLESAGLVYKVCRIEKPFIPLSAYSDPTVFKLYMADVGLLRKMSKLPYEVVLDATPTYTEFKGAMTENFVLCEWLQASGEIPFYWTSGNSAEVDFVVQSGAEIIPVEVKSEKNVKAKSLAEYRKKYEPAHSVKTSMRSEISGKEIVNIPLYLIAQMKNFL